MRAHAFHMETPRARGGLTFFHSAATCLHSPAARPAGSRQTRRGSAGPTNGTWSAAVKSWAAYAPLALPDCAAPDDARAQVLCSSASPDGDWLPLQGDSFR